MDARVRTRWAREFETIVDCATNNRRCSGGGGGGDLRSRCEYWVLLAYETLQRVAARDWNVCRSASILSNHPILPEIIPSVRNWMTDIQLTDSFLRNQWDGRTTIVSCSVLSPTTTSLVCQLFVPSFSVVSATFHSYSHSLSPPSSSSSSSSVQWQATVHALPFIPLDLLFLVPLRQFEWFMRPFSETLSFDTMEALSSLFAISAIHTPTIMTAAERSVVLDSACHIFHNTSSHNNINTNVDLGSRAIVGAVVVRRTWHHADDVAHPPALLSQEEESSVRFFQIASLFSH